MFSKRHQLHVVVQICQQYSLCLGNVLLVEVTVVFLMADKHLPQSCELYQGEIFLFAVRKKVKTEVLNPQVREKLESKSHCKAEGEM